MDSVGAEANYEVGRELCRFVSSSTRLVSTSPEAPSAGPQHVPHLGRRHYQQSIVHLRIMTASEHKGQPVHLPRLPP
jgi:hypothetical protein